MNFIIQSRIAGELHSYKSINSVTDYDKVTNYPTKFLNSLEFTAKFTVEGGIDPNHIAKSESFEIVQHYAIVRQESDEQCDSSERKLSLIPRIPIIPTDFPFQFKLIQFTVRLAFAMIMNKSQG